jgi:hypothetical protein
VSLKPTKAEIAHWEGQLKKHGLSNAQLNRGSEAIVEVKNELDETTEPSDEDDLRLEDIEHSGGIQNHQFDGDVEQDWQSSARDQVDGSELHSFAPVHVRKYTHDAPTWTLNDIKIQELLTNAFPRLKTSEKQRAKAARWNLIIYRYYRLGHTASRIAEDLSTEQDVVTTKTVESILERIRKHGEVLDKQTRV